MRQETQRAFCVRKRALISLNLASGGSDDRRLRELKAGLGSANRSWMRACGALERWEAGLHAALMQCQVRPRGFFLPLHFKQLPFARVAPQDFHQSLHSLLSWLSQAEQTLCAVGAQRHRPSYAALLEQRHALRVRERHGARPLLRHPAALKARSGSPPQALREELRGRQAAASSLRAAAARLLLEAGGGEREDCVEAGEKVHVVANKMKLLLRRVHGSLAHLQRDLRDLQRQQVGRAAQLRGALCRTFNPCEGDILCACVRRKGRSQQMTARRTFAQGTFSCVSISKDGCEGCLLGGSSRLSFSPWQTARTTSLMTLVRIEYPSIRSPSRLSSRAVPAGIGQSPSDRSGNETNGSKMRNLFYSHFGEKLFL